MGAKKARENPWFWTGGAAGLHRAYVVFLATVGRFVGSNEAFFKAPGREWASHPPIPSSSAFSRCCGASDRSSLSCMTP
jgi:hypothetical protein